MEHNNTTYKSYLGIDLGDVYSYWYFMTDDGEEANGRTKTKVKAIADLLAEKGQEHLEVAIEVGTHSRWVSAVIQDMGHEAVVANPRKVRLIYAGNNKSDRLDAENLARLLRVDRKLLHPIKHRNKECQTALASIKSRGQMVKQRTAEVNFVKGALKSFGVYIEGFTVETFHRCGSQIPDELLPAYMPHLELICKLNKAIKEYDQALKDMCTELKETQQLTQVYGVGVITALCFILTLEETTRFKNSRQVGAYLGLVPKKRGSGKSNPELGITKAGDRLLRCLLVQCANCILRENSPDSDLKRWGHARLTGGSRVRKVVVVAIARKLSVLLHRLWTTGEKYVPLKNTLEKEMELKKSVI